ncbi:DUF4232 domain-containing protein [Trueperella sp. LYQ141]|uniref:DUF4232 domain-containing protein n=1 Tax=Trueperella sp. LYQ141 TaxID=3391058 RepID=UPI00398352BD
MKRQRGCYVFTLIAVAALSLSACSDSSEIKQGTSAPSSESSSSQAASSSATPSPSSAPSAATPSSDATQQVSSSAANPSAPAQLAPDESVITRTLDGKPICTPEQLHMQVVNPPGSGAAGSIHYRVDAKNISTQACAIPASPAMQFRDASGAIVGFPPEWDGGKSEDFVTIEPNHTASADLSWGQVGAYSGCGVVTAKTVDMYLAQSGRKVSSHFDADVCSAFSNTTMKQFRIDAAG